MTDTDQPTELAALSAKLATVTLPNDLKERVNSMVARLNRVADTALFAAEYERVSHYLEWITKIPFSSFTPDRLDLAAAKQVLDAHHYGLESVKDRLLEYLSVLKLNSSQQTAKIVKAPSLLLVGLVGTGKTTFAYSLAEAMGRKIARIPFGGMGSARDLRGQSRQHPEAEPGYFVKALIRAESYNPIILLDEIDRVSQEATADIMGVLVEALDPEQNRQFLDHYIDYPIDLTQCLFIATANGTSHIATAVMDRLEPISMPSYTDEEKIVIAKQYLLPKALQETGLPDGFITFDDNTWNQIVRPLGYDAGIRTLQRTIRGIVRKAAREHVEHGIANLSLTPSNIKEYLPTYESELS